MYFVTVCFNPLYFALLIYVSDIIYIGETTKEVMWDHWDGRDVNRAKVYGDSNSNHVDMAIIDSCFKKNLTESSPLFHRLIAWSRT